MLYIVFVISCFYQIIVSLVFTQTLYVMGFPPSCPNCLGVATITLVTLFLSFSPEQLRNRRAWCSEEDEVLALSRLSMVMKALTPRHFDVVVCLAKKLKSSPELGGEKEYNAGIGI